MTAPPLMPIPSPAPAPAILDPEVVPGASDEPPLISADMHPPVDLAEDLERFNARLATYLKPEDIKPIGAAYMFAGAAHRGQLRVSGAPYISHPLAVAETLAGWHLDPNALIAALLHDVMEDTSITKEQIAERFGKVAADLVDGVSKLDRIEHQSFEEAQAENFRKMLLAMARDVRVILIKLADRLHNMRTLDAMRTEKRRRIARETLDIYAPIANRLGLNALYRELQELGFQHAHPLRYRVLSKAVKGARGNRREVVSKILQSIRKTLPEAGIAAEVMGREKHLYGIYRKMREKQLSFSQVLDIYGFRIIVKDRQSCYLALGALHALYQPVPGKFKDYIAIPKANGYQSLHTTLIGPFGTPAEIQIRDGNMHHVAESGVASHWLYKDKSTLDQLQQKTHKWLQSLVELQSTTGDSSEFLEHVKVDLFPSEVYVFSPKGKIFALPRGSTAVDLAYAVHTDIGDRCVACRINFETMPLRTELRNGDRVEIVTATSAAPNPSWLGYVKSARARSRIRHFLKARHNEEGQSLGERLLVRALAELGHTLAEVDEPAWESFLFDTGRHNRNEIFADIGLGIRLAPIVARRLMARDENLQQAVRDAGSVVIRGTESGAVQLAPCCRPIPGDPIVGLIRKGHGLVVHTHDCSTLAKLRSSKLEWIDVEWEAGITGMFEASIRVLTRNERGVLARLAAEIAETESNIVDVSMVDDSGDASTLFFTLQVADRSHLARIMRALRRVPEVVRINRYADSKH
ncbi:MAG: bifunctional (p)ppGpp synthetase/guanosine-3',5'-bis(diphosphate) 3'-pyrophosphohydrolase [Burkholderiaceae bacterium]|nr:bifunctional (p)ppGpp synthetase/guanosine-3',5'-bis(diphosphate) 3'-pyrophosphohydrolase [Burkholderiaceae bacterium]